MTNGEKFKEVFGFGVDGSRVIAVNATWLDCEFQNRKPITNADRIRTMSDEELAQMFWEIAACELCQLRKRHCSDNCKDTWLEWLRKETMENECDCKEIFENTADCPCDNCEKMKE